ncbi:hypothetical protein PM082_021288 [Marasmius tenuissimus]|nr:hypothetical protein PM082_021288 [Marasmius tenuissimus]
MKIPDPTPTIPSLPRSYDESYRPATPESLERCSAASGSHMNDLWKQDGPDVMMEDGESGLGGQTSQLLGGLRDNGSLFSHQTPLNGTTSLPTPSSMSNASFSLPILSQQMLGSPISLQQSPPPFTPLHDLSIDVPDHPTRLVLPRKSKSERDYEKLVEEYATVTKILEFISKTNLTVGRFFLLFVSNPKDNLRSSLHKKLSMRLLQGQDVVKFLEILKAAYNHRNAYPSHRSRYKSERAQSFSVSGDPMKLHYARVAMSSWSAQLCVNRASCDLDTLVKEECEETRPEDAARVRMPAKDVTWEDIGNFSPKRSVDTFRRRGKFLSTFMEQLVNNGTLRTEEETERGNRPTDMVLLASMNPLIIARNERATGYLSMPLGIHEFATQTHMDIKRLTCRLGLSVSDNTTRQALATMTGRDLEVWRNMNAEAAAEGKLGSIQIIDNTQRQIEAREGGLFRQNELKTGTACTSLKVHDSPPGAWSLPDHLSRVAKNERSTLTTSKLFFSIDWKHHYDVSALHVAHALIKFIPVLGSLYESVLMDRFRSPPIAIYRIPDDHRSVIQPLGTNAEREVETQGLKRCIIDFDEQAGLTTGDDEEVLEWVGGDGATFATFQRLQKYLAPTSHNNRDTLRNKIATPEAWHAKHTALIACSENHFGPATCSDPSSMSKLYASINFKRPADLKKCDHYPTADGLTLIWIGQVLDCWRVLYGVDDLEVYFESLEKDNKIPSFEDLLSKACLLVERYTSIRAHEHALSAELHQKATPSLHVPNGTPWTSNTVISTSTSGTNDPGKAKGKDSENDQQFDGDQSLANSILFKFQFGSWLALDFAIHDGDIGRVMEQLKIWIFMFAGSTHQQYFQYLLELHCLLEHESSPALRTAILNNYLVKFGLRAKERDLMQEDHNKKLEAMVTKAGGNFDDPYYRTIISPNVHRFVELRGTFETAFDLYHRSNKHTSPHMKPELRVLLQDLKNYEHAYFRKARHYGHVAVNLLGAGYRALEEGGKMDNYLGKSSAKSKFITAIEREKNKVNINSSTDTQVNITSNLDCAIHESEEDESRNNSSKEDEDSTSEGSDGSDDSDSGSEREHEQNERETDGEDREDMFGYTASSDEQDESDKENKDGGLNTDDDEGQWSGSDT